MVLSPDSPDFLDLGGGIIINTSKSALIKLIWQSLPGHWKVDRTRVRGLLSHPATCSELNNFVGIAFCSPQIPPPPTNAHFLQELKYHEEERGGPSTTSTSAVFPEPYLLRLDPWNNLTVWSAPKGEQSSCFLTPLWVLDYYSGIEPGEWVVIMEGEGYWIMYLTLHMHGTDIRKLELELERGELERPDEARSVRTTYNR
ncbi:MAG: hypothetical protein M1834_006390 [Cirrosporium novae-zelandiae]|nr:MAG: hypothetical protein M1834_006390 [Cirrosporium novae-zelandiae]